MSERSCTVSAGPLPMYGYCSSGGAPGASPDAVPSSTIATSGRTRRAAAAAPRNPTSSWTLQTAVTGTGGLRWMMLASTAHPARSSKALPFRVVPQDS